MASLILVPRSVEGFACAAVLARHLRFQLLEATELAGEELRFTDPSRIARQLEEAAGRPLARVMVSGAGQPADPSRAAAALERMKYAGVELDWFEPRPWPDGAVGERLARHARLHLASRGWPNAAQFLLTRLELRDARARHIVNVSLAPAAQPVDHPDRGSLRRWHYLLCALAHEDRLPRAREALRRLAFDGARLQPGDEPLIAEESDRRRWLARDFHAQSPYPTLETATRQRLAVADLRRETGAPVLRPVTAARALSRIQRVRYTLVALSAARGWRAWLHAWPSGVGELARVPGLAEAPGAGFQVRFEGPGRARFLPAHDRATLFGLARALAGRL